MISFTVHGLPIAQGSKRQFKPPNAKFPVMVDTNQKKLRPWRSLVHDTAVGAMNGSNPIDGPVKLTLLFILPRPKSHYRTGRNASILKDTAPQWHTGTPDLDKLLRAVCDSLTGIVWHDDKQVSGCIATKCYGIDIGVHVIVEPMEKLELKTGELMEGRT